MHLIVLLAELATVGFFAVFLGYAATHADRGPAFAIKTTDRVARTLIRSAQIAFVVGYGAFFAATAARAVGVF